MKSMIPSRIVLSLAAACLAPFASLAQEEPPAAKLTIRTFFNDPTRPGATFFVPEAPDRLVSLVLAPGELPSGQAVTLIGGRLDIHDSARIDPARPEASLVASAPVPKDLKQAIVIIQPRGDAKKPPCGIVFIDDSLAAFPPGESRVVSFTTLPIAIQAGEHKLPIAAGKITPVPPVAKVDAYNMAQTNFLYQTGDGWVPFSEARMKYLKDYRQVFLCIVRPGSKTPALVTLVDDTPKAAAP